MSEVYDKTKPSNKGDATDKFDVLNAADGMAERFFGETAKKDIERERRQTMKTKGVFVPVKWVKRYDPVVALYLSHFTHYVGSQARKDGYVWDSEDEVEEKTGITPKRQKRCRKVLRADGVIQVKYGKHRTLMLRPNLPFLALWDSMDSYEEAVEKVMEEPDNPAPQPAEEPEEATAEASPDDDQREPSSCQKGTTMMTKGTHHDDKRYSLYNCNSSVIRCNSSQDDDSETPTDPRVDKCLEVLEEIENFRKDRKNIASTLEKLIVEYPRSNPVEVCDQLRNYASTQSVKNPTALLGKFFEQDEAKRASEPRHPHGAGTPVFVAPRREKEPKIDPREIQRLMDEGLTDAQIQAYIRMHTAEQREAAA